MARDATELSLRPGWARRLVAGPRILALRRYGLQIGTVAMALLLWVIYAVKAPETWLSDDRIYSSLMSTVPFTAVMALGLTLVVIAREIDLSFPSVMAVSALVFVETPGDPVFGLLAGVGAGLVVGLLNGLVVVKLGIPSLVATIGTLFFWRGIVLVATGGNGSGLTDESASWVGRVLVGRIADGRIPAQMLWTLGFAVCLWLLLNRHRFGAHVYLVGDNVESAKMMGVNADRVRTAVFTMLGGLAGFAGIVSGLEVSYFWPTGGEGQLLPTIVAVFIGGTSVFGGTGTIFGTTLGSFITGSIEPGIVSIGLTGFYTQVIWGAMIVLALVMQAVVMRRVGR
ncbi:MAG: sugar ABC transporter permease [Thermoleophilia bacterium]